MKQRISNLFTIKSIVTLVLTGVFAYLSIIKTVTAEQFLTIFTVVIAFYFGTQAAKREEQKGDGTDDGQR